MRKFLLACLAVGLVLTAAAAPVQDNQQKLKDAIAWLHKIEPQLSADVKAMVPDIESILDRYYTDPDSLRQSEKDLAEAFIATMPSSGDELSGRASSDERMKDFESLLGSTPKKPATPTTHTPAKPKPKIPGISSHPTFSAVDKTAPGGKHIGAVIVSIDGRKKTVIEILSTVPKMSLADRARVIANRMRGLSAKNPLWWTTVKPGSANGEAIVRAAGAPILVTADKPFANECGMSPDQLAKQLAVKIRTTFDPNSGDEFGGRDLTPDQMRQAAIDLRQEGDDVYSDSPAQAEDKYKQAIENDATYFVPYLRLADLYKAQNKIDAAKDILNQGLKVDAIQGDERSQLEAKLKSLG
ncbi:MAG TPA: tetratricopeptide repeat protein [Fimbriimonadaceae bacterium]|nr:tetratricopeptide repeat protein [Fimbriimonadaceae bacterium]